MSVVGFEFGNYTCFIGIARQGGIDVVANEFSYRHTSSMVSFGQKKRFLGENAKTQQTANVKNTIYSFKRLLGRKFSDPEVQEEAKHLYFELSELPDDNIGIKVEYMGEPKVFTPLQLTSMLLSQLKHTAQANTNSKVSDCVISVPGFWNDTQRRELLAASEVAGLNTLRLINDTTAAALQYGIYKQDLPVAGEKPRTVVFVDLGQSSLQTAVVAFNKGKLVVKAYAYDSGVGGRDFDLRLVEHFAKVFKDTYKVDAHSKKKAMLRLTTECEKIKKLMSANTGDVPLNIESFLDDIDVRGRICRAEFEGLCKDLLDRIEAPLRKVLTDSSLQPEDIHSVEIIGGSSRVPTVKTIIKQVFGIEPSTTLNQDEAVSRGCALQCALASPQMKVREFSILDISPYAIEITWPSSQNVGELSRSEVFTSNNKMPSQKVFSFYRREDFELTASYMNPAIVPGGNALISRFAVKGLMPDKNGEPSKVKVKLALNSNGILQVDSANRLEEVEEIVPVTVAPPPKKEAEKAPAPETNGDAPKNDDAPKNGDATTNAKVPNGDAMDTSADSPASSATPAAESTISTEVRKVTKKHPLVVETVFTQSPTSTVLQTFIECENAMVSSDKLAFETENARNAVEEYVYDMRDKLCEQYSEYVSEEQKSTFSSLLSGTEDWLYEDGEDASRSVYVDKLGELKSLGDPIVLRAVEDSTRAPAVEALRMELVLSRKAVSMFSDGHELYNHIDAAEMKKVEDECTLKETWLNANEAKQLKFSKYDAPILMTAQVVAETNSLVRVCKPILNTPKPVATPPSAPAASPKAEANGTSEETPKENQEAAQEAPATDSTPDMDLD